VTPPGGSWDVNDAGTYVVGLVGGQVLDILGLSVAADPSLTSFDVLPGKLLNESFETDGQGLRYTASPPFNNGVDDYWDRGEPHDFDTLTNYVGWDGAFFWAVEDTDSSEGNGSLVQTIEFAPINISGHENLEFSGLFASTANSALGPGFPFGGDQHIKVLYSVDGGLFQEGLCFVPNGDDHLALDENCDGVAEGPELTATFGTWPFKIPNGSTLDLRIEVQAELTSQELAFDNLMVTGQFVPSPYDLWVSSFGLSGADALFDADPDEDGGRNGYEYGTGTIPTNTLSITPLSLTVTGQTVMIHFTRNTNAVDASLFLQRSADLSNPHGWTGHATNSLGVWMPSGIVIETGTGNPVDVEVADSTSNNPAASYRLEISR
jgi:hypothetical protein